MEKEIIKIGITTLSKKEIHQLIDESLSLAGIGDGKVSEKEGKNLSNIVFDKLKELCPLNPTSDSKRAQNSGTIELKHWSSHDYEY